MHLFFLGWWVRVVTLTRLQIRMETFIRVSASASGRNCELKNAHPTFQAASPMVGKSAGPFIGGICCLQSAICPRCHTHMITLILIVTPGRHHSSEFTGENNRLQAWQPLPRFAEA